MVIVGGGHVGGRAAQALREGGWTGPIVRIGAEAHPPYERPPLSKGLLAGQQTAADCALRPPAVEAAEGIQALEAWAEGLDLARREVLVVGGPQRVRRRIRFAGLLLATGGHPRRLDVPGADAAGLLSLRTLDDATALAQRLRAPRPAGAGPLRLVVVGGGFIGLEVAATARALGAEVTLLEGAPRLLGRSLPAAMADQVAALHRRHGVDLRLGCPPLAFARQPDGRTRVTLPEGEALLADAVVVGIGITPATELAQQAGLTLGPGGGIQVDAQLQTSAPGIYAAGDVAEFPSPLSGALIRQETWLNADTQARVAAANLLGQGLRYEQPAGFWSDQYGHQVQVAGEPALGVRTVRRLLRGADPLADPLGAQIDFHLNAAGQLVGASGFGPVADLAKEFKLARLLVERRRQPPPEALADPTLKLKSLA
ncbi:oxidoreductase [Ideonella sp. TBM-1]|uniref:Oxidoreductase n=2 Tax=Ideonella livida TaxID=2707176 RepID=A0A7C9PHF3_9BURK|nr:oxidoreductase [Ideonella livida]